MPPNHTSTRTTGKLMENFYALGDNDVGFYGYPPTRGAIAGSSSGGGAADDLPA